MTETRVLIYVGHFAAVGVSWGQSFSIYNISTRYGKSFTHLPYASARYVEMGLVLSFIGRFRIEADCLPGFFFIGFDTVNCDV